MLADPRVAETGAVTCERCAVPRRANHHERLPGSRRTRSRGSRDPFRMATSGIAGNTFASIAVDAFGGAVRVPHAFPSRPSEIACKAPIFKMRTATDRAGASHRVPKRAPELLDRRRGAARRVRALAGRRGRPPAARRSLASSRRVERSPQPVRAVGPGRRLRGVGFALLASGSHLERMAVARSNGDVARPAFHAGVEGDAAVLRRRSAWRSARRLQRAASGRRGPSRM
jgi:hypothetical protein